VAYTYSVDHAKRRMFAITTDLGFGIARMFQMLANTETDIHVCRSHEEAVDCLS